MDEIKSTMDYAFTLGSGVISCGSKNQHSMALLTTKVEYKATIGVTCEAIWLRRILCDLKLS